MAESNYPLEIKEVNGMDEPNMKYLITDACPRNYID
jgi:hypothetical protein